MLGAETTARANVNVALIKYWGKRDPVLNLPATGSISLTIDGLGVEATCGFGVESVLLIDGDPAPTDDAARVLRFVDLVRSEARIDARVRS
jgi:diphosphomevalonate decarboxylase